MGYIEESQVLLYEELCAKPYDENDPRIRATILFRENLKLVPYVVHKIAPSLKYRNDSCLDLEDLIQEGYLGLWLACIRYNGDRGAAFSTFAVPCIKGVILKAMSDTEILHTPRSYKNIRACLNKYNLELPLTDEEIDFLVKEEGLPKKQLEKYVAISVSSIYEPLSNDESLTLLDMLSESGKYSESLGYFERDWTEDEIEGIVSKIMELLGECKYRDLYEEYIYASLEGVKLTQSVIAKKYNMSQPHASRIIKDLRYRFKFKLQELKKIL